MKIIDLLNKLANGEEVPEIIKYNNNIYTHNDMDKYNYYCKEIGKVIEEDIIFERLNDEIEIIEDGSDINVGSKKIEKIPEVEIATSMAIGEKICARKINEIIDYISKENE